MERNRPKLYLDIVLPSVYNPDDWVEEPNYVEQSYVDNQAFGKLHQPNVWTE
jgi:hypothetical protein